jgi:hypothetical protein
MPFPGFSPGQVYGAIAYYLDNQTAIDRYLAHSEATEGEFSREIARLYPKRRCAQGPPATERAEIG